MTREEAIAIFSAKKIGKDWEADWIDKFVALGLLKLDEPKSVADEAGDAVAKYLGTIYLTPAPFFTRFW